MLDKIWKSSIKIKLILSILIISAFCITITLVIAYTSSKAALTNMANDQLSSMLAISKKRVGDYYKRTKTFTELLSTDRLTEGLFLSYESAFYAAGYSIGKDQIINSDSFTKLDEVYSRKTIERAESYDIANFLLVNITGQVVYSARPKDYGFFEGRSLTKGELSNSKLAQCVKSAKESNTKNVYYADYEYLPQYKRTMAFYCLNVFAEFIHLSEGINKGDLLGTMVVEIDPNKITSFLSARDGMGATGQTYLVGDDGLLRSDFFINKEKYNVINSHKEKLKIENAAILSVLNEKKEITSNLNDPNGNNVLSAMAPVQIEGKTWVLVSEKQNSEILEPVRELLKQVFLYASIVLLGVVFVGIALSKKLLSPIIMASETLVQVCNSLNTDSNHLTQSASTLAESSKDQANNLQTTVQAVHEISSTIEQNTNNAKNSEALAKHSLEAAEKGREVITQMMQSMSDINSGNQEILLQVEDRQINEILVMISEIGNKTKLINDIVFQTKLLSFNASVEAARAGENGKGFAVVAEEIGNLAQSSGNSAKEISDLLSVSITKVESIIRDTTQKIGNVSTLGRERVKTGQETAKKCSESFDEIVKSFNQVAVLVSEISHASNEQNLGMSEINEAMIRLNAGTDKSTQIASDSSEAATKLESRAKTLEEVVQNIQEVIHGVKST
jgi:methyl-accepting chemotaxis protein